MALKTYILVGCCLLQNLGFVGSLKTTRTSNSHFMVSTSIEELGLPSGLQRYVQLFRDVPDEKLRYQQLLFFASKLEPMPNEFKTPENKVQGCLSTVHVHARTEDGKIYFKGDSDGQLTKGLVALLVNGLSGCTAEEINSVKPEFIQYAGIASSLTPGRNNGFLNMLALIKKKAKDLDAELKGDTSTSTTNNESNKQPIYDAIIQKLSMLKPIQLEVEDESHQHAGHAAMKNLASSETHFKVTVVASCFENLSLVQRHKMIYTLLNHEMNNGIHALSIVAKTPDEMA
eukprot:gene13658-29030_t